MSERQRLFERLAKAKDEGLVSAGWLLRPRKPIPQPEDIYAAMNEIEDAIEAGRCVRHKDWKGNEPS